MIRPPYAARLAATATLFLFSGCSRESAGDFGVSMTGPFEGTVRGLATFCTRPDRRDFVLFLRDPQNGAGFDLRRENPVRPEPGSYGMAKSRDTGEEAPGAFRLEPQLKGIDGGDQYQYYVKGGKVRIISSDSARVRGRFEADVVASDPTPEVDQASGKVRILRTEAIKLTGQFTAARAERCEPPAG